MRLIPASAPALLAALAVALYACGGGSSEPKVTPTPEPTPTPGINAQGVRYCAYVPGESEPADMPSEVRNPRSPTPSPEPEAPDQTNVSAETRQEQLALFDALNEVVIDTYVHPDFIDREWTAISARYEALVTAGLSDDDFYTAMRMMIAELGDDHSYFESPDEAAEDERLRIEGLSFVGIGVIGLPVEDTGVGTVITVFPGSPADEAGIRPHDLLLEVDGEPYLDEDGQPRSLGTEGSSFELKYRRQSGAENTVTLTRRAVAGFTPVDYCIVPGTGIGYVMLPTFADENVDDEVRAALQKLTAGGPLDGLVLDNRLNGGGLNRVLEPVLGFFTSGIVGEFVDSEDRRPLEIDAEDVGGSQTVPLVVLSGSDTESYAEVFTGVLQLSGRAVVIGDRTAGNVETLHNATFPDGSRVWLATETFAPVGLEAGAWEGSGISPDISLPTRWDLFTEATDPALARAVEELQ